MSRARKSKAKINTVSADTQALLPAVVSPASAAPAPLPSPTDVTLNLVRECQQYAAENHRNRLGGPLTGFTPFQKLIDVILNPKAPEAVQVRAALGLAEYWAPRLRGIELSSEHTENINVTIKKFVREVRDGVN